MQKNWYIIYTKPKSEKKVAALLTKKKIENFCPLNCKSIVQFRRSKLVYEPLFVSYVFVNIQKNEINLLKQIENVVSLVFWKGEPAVIHHEEIEAIKDFTSDHQNIKLERTQVNLNGDAIIDDDRSYSIDGKVLLIKNKSMRINLPSLGFTMIAELEGEGVLGREVSFGNKEFSLQ
ncbi:MAG: transcription termination/antitermination NusG family protein [Ginsengibacter sp.]